MESVWLVAARGTAAYLAMVCSVAVVGWGVLWALRKMARVAPSPLSLAQVFVAAALGFFTLVLLTAVVYTRGNTSMWLIVVVLLLIVFACFEERVLEKLLSREGRAPWPWLIAAIVLPFVLFASVTYRFDGGFAYRTTYFDHYVFRTMVEGLARTGIESRFALSQVVDIAGHRPVPYHYLDLWMMVLGRAELPVPVLELVCLTVPALSLCVVLLGLFAVGEVMGVRSAWGFMLLPLALIGQVLWWPELERYWLTLGSGAFAGGLGYVDMVVIAGKNFPSLLVGLLVVLLLALNARMAALAAASLFLLADITQVTTLGALMLSLLAYSWREPWRVRLTYLAIPLMASLCFLSFYGVNAWLACPNTSSASGGLAAWLTALTENIPVRVNTMIKMALQIGLLLSPYVVIGYLFRRQWWSPSYRYLLLGVALTALLGLIGWDLTRPMDPANAIQMLDDGSGLMFALGVAVMIAVLSHRKAWIPLGLLVALIVLSFGLRYSREAADPHGRPRPQSSEFLIQVAAYQPANSIGAYLKDSADLKSPWQNYRKPEYVRSVGSLEQFFMPQYVGTVFINDPIVPYNEPGLWHLPINRFQLLLIEKQPFMRYWLRAKQAEPQVTIGRAQICFLARHQIDWVLATPSVTIQSELLRVTRKTLVDPAYGDRMLLLDVGLLASTCKTCP